MKRTKEVYKDRMTWRFSCRGHLLKREADLGEFIEYNWKVEIVSVKSN